LVPAYVLCKKKHKKYIKNQKFVLYFYFFFNNAVLVYLWYLNDLNFICRHAPYIYDCSLLHASPLIICVMTPMSRCLILVSVWLLLLGSIVQVLMAEE